MFNTVHARAIGDCVRILVRVIMAVAVAITIHVFDTALVGVGLLFVVLGLILRDYYLDRVAHYRAEQERVIRALRD